MFTIAFVPGAWITPAFYEPFHQAVNSAGHEFRYASYPSLDPADPSTTDCETDAKDIARILRSIVEGEGKDVFLVMHSYAGMPGSAAAVGLGKSQRKEQGKPGGIIGLVFIGAFVIPEGLSCAGLQGGQLPRWILLDKVLSTVLGSVSLYIDVKPQPSHKLNVPDDPFINFLGDVDRALVNGLDDKIKPYSTLAFTSPQPHPAWADSAFQGRSAFIVTAEDRAVPKEAQYAMMAASQQKWIVKKIESSHCGLFLNRTQETVRLLQEIV